MSMLVSNLSLTVVYVILQTWRNQGLKVKRHIYNVSTLPLGYRGGGWNDFKLQRNLWKQETINASCSKYCYDILLIVETFDLVTD